MKTDIQKDNKFLRITWGLICYKIKFFNQNNPHLTKRCCRVFLCYNHVHTDVVLTAISILSKAKLCNLA